MAFRPCHAAQTPWPQDKLSWWIVTEEPVGQRSRYRPGPAVIYMCSRKFKQPLGTELCSCKEICNSSDDQKGGASLRRQDLRSVPWGNPSGLCPTLREHGVPSIWRDVVCIPLLVVYMLSIFLFLFCLIKTAVLFSHLLSGLSYWDPVSTLHCLSCT